MKFKTIHQHREYFELSVMCRILKVSRQGYHAWIKRQYSLAPATLRRKNLLGEIRKIHADSEGTYGSPRIHRELQENQIFCCVKTVAKLMKLKGIRADLPRRFVPQTTDSDHEHPVFENKLRVSIFLWIEGWYNRRRRHSALGYVSPEEFEASLN